MERLLQRSIVWSLVIILLITTVPITDIRAVTYETGDAGAFTNVIKNWGVRGIDASYLSDKAQAFYANAAVTYDDLSTLEGASEVSTVPGSSLYGALNQLMSSAHTTITSYADTKDLYRFTDCQNGDDSSISSFYSGTSIGPEWDSGATWNREHTWPDSKGLGGDDENDIMMLRPTSGGENSSRGNKAYGESSGFFDPNSVSSGTYDLRGDVARIALYVYVRWGNTAKMWGTDGMIESVDVLLTWMENDPVDTWELGRNDSVESITGTRNVFVDYPELGFLLFDREVPSDMATPSGEASSSDAYTIFATVSDQAHGSVSVSGNVVNAFPAAGYEVCGYTLVSGSAEVIRNGNAFTVVTSEDCEIRVEFAARGSVTVDHLENGVVASSVTVYSGDSVQLPAHTGTVVAGYNFLGWVEGELASTTVVPKVIYTAGSSYVATSDVELHALYSRVDESGTGTASVYKLYSGILVEGDYLIAYDGGALQAAIGTSNRLAYLDITVTNDAVENPDPTIVWHIAPTDDGYFTLYNKTNGVYAGGTGVKNKAGLLTSVTDHAKWTVTGEEKYEFENLGNFDAGVNYKLRRNSTYGYACYAASTGGTLSLYQAVSGTVYYSTFMEPCKHSNTHDVAQQDASCTEDGHTAGVFCDDCASYISGHEPLKASGHSYEAVVTEPTATEQGFTTYTCSVCSDSYIGDHTAPVGQERTVHFVVPDGVASVEEMQCDNRGITLPEADVPEGEYIYSFAGWAVETVDNSEKAPELYPAGSNYVADSDVTLYAVYTYLVGEAGTGAWDLVTDVSALHSGAQLVIAAQSKGVVAGRISSQYLTNVNAVFSEDGTMITELPAEAVVFTLGGSEGNWTLSDADGQLLGATAVKKLAWNKGTTTWSISVENGDATISSTNSSYGRFLYNVNSPRFTTYTSKASVSMLMPQLYSKDLGSGTVYYTTEISHPCDHDGETLVQGQIDPDYLNDGYTGDVYCAECGELLEQGSAVSRNPFEDVPEDQFTDAILWAYYGDITKGTSETTFSPDEFCTREYLVTFLWRAMGCPEPISRENPFTDVPEDQFTDAILWAYEVGITKGKTATTFCPDDPCTREQAVTMLWRLCGRMDPASAENPFTDVPDDQFADAILWAYYFGITKGKTATTFCPDDLCSREQIVTFLFRLTFRNDK